MIEQREFDLGAILTVITGRYLCTNIDDLYDLLEWVTGDKPFTHQLPRFSEEAGAALLREHPALSEIVVPDDLSGADDCRTWLAEQAAQYGAWLPVAALAAKADHAKINPLVELMQMRRK